MLSRVAENLYWMARYLERAENTARLINSTTQVLLDLPRGASFGWDVLIKVAGQD
ncbi:MAG: alpha-E domain-containing protein [Hydrogenophilaceae bacterium]|nr:alpha-E domain-containing protein [Hydrogenophilaceae bacterium]